MENIKKWFVVWMCCTYQLVLCQVDKKVIILDPGHGGKDTGAASDDGLEEKDIVLDIAKEILYWNKVLLKDEYEIYLTRSKDTLISLAHRTKLAQYLKPDLFLSLHCNHATNSGAKGIEIYMYKNILPGSTFSKMLYKMSKRIMEKITMKMGFESRGIKMGNFQVLRDATDRYPAILMELGFLSNNDEAGYLNNRGKREALALAILMAI